MLTSKDLPPMSAVSVKLNGVVQATPRFSGPLSEKARIQTSSNGHIVDENLQIQARVEKTRPFKGASIALADNTNSAASGMIVRVSFSLAVLASDEVHVKIPNGLEKQIIQSPSDIYCGQCSCSFTANYIKISGIKSNPAVVRVFGLVNPKSTRPFGPFEIELVDKSQRQLQSWAEQINLQTTVPSQAKHVRLIQESTRPGRPTNFSLAVEKSFNSLKGDSPPWVKLSLPDCITTESGKSL